ncbi:hypothetical protein PGTUg99_015741 [Puccinia graminis f. sp. tritici]|uniref:Uncharacterized protein n=1 Tax=Puccinia graminis f. sp. tritici TaxID=56615 RepID=A0A5B0RCP0_PUCGR|nr:hypothetical protein PGTUg99_015741 [Puccinia graminis f. sp. tritici]
MKQGAQIVQTGILGFSIYLSNGHTNKIHPAQLSLFFGRLLLKNTLRDFLRIFSSGDFTTNFCIFKRRFSLSLTTGRIPEMMLSRTIDLDVDSFGNASSYPLLPFRGIGSTHTWFPCHRFLQQSLSQKARVYLRPDSQPFPSPPLSAPNLNPSDFLCQPEQP